MGPKVWRDTVGEASPPVRVAGTVLMRPASQHKLIGYCSVCHTDRQQPHLIPPYGRGGRVNTQSAPPICINTGACRYSVVLGQIKAGVWVYMYVRVCGCVCTMSIGNWVRQWATPNCFEFVMHLHWHFAFFWMIHIITNKI